MASVLACSAWLGACGGARLDANAELKNDDLALANDSKRPAPTASSTPAPAPLATEPPAPAPAPPPTADTPLACPVRCAIATPRHRTLATDEEERLRAAVTPTLSGLRSCMSNSNEERHHRPPGVVLRFATSGDVLDVVIDDTGWGETNADACFQSLARGPSLDVHIEGPATVRCAEHCERPKPAPKATIQKATPKKK